MAQDAAPPADGTRLPVVDLVRLISIALVLALHLDGAKLTSGPTNELLAVSWRYLMRNAVYGVSFFFVVSGLVITRSILTRHADLAQLDLRDFYVRRAARILPTLLLAIAVGAVLLVTVPVLKWRVPYTFHDPRASFDLVFWLSIFTFSFNWLRIARRHETPAFGLHWDVLWSLAIEEQFYLVYPITLRILRTRRAAIMALGLVVGSGPIARLMSNDIDPGFLVTFTNTFVCLDFLAVGCLVAFALEALPRVAESGARRWLEHGLGIAALVIVILVYRFTFLGDPGDRTWAPSVLALGVGAFLAFGIRLGWGASRPMRALVAVGQLSYGLYLFHPVILWASWRLLRGSLFSGLLIFGAISILFAFVLQRFFERPADRWVRARLRGLFNPAR